MEAELADDTQPSSVAGDGSGADAQVRNMSNLDRMYLLNRLTIMPAAIGSRIETAMIAFSFTLTKRSEQIDADENIQGTSDRR